MTNLGIAYHNFVICTKPVAAATGAKNACVGKKTVILKPKQSATLTVIIPKTGKYEFLCSVTGHAAAGMKGLIGIGVPVTLAEQKIAAKAGSATGGGGTGGGGTGGRRHRRRRHRRRRHRRRRHRRRRHRRAEGLSRPPARSVPRSVVHRV